MSQVASPHNLVLLGDYRLVAGQPAEKRLLFAVCLLETFGLRYAKYIYQTSVGEIKELFGLVWRSCSEIQKNLQKGENFYLPEGSLFRETRKVIDWWRRNGRTAGRTDQQLFTALRVGALRTLCFPSAMLTYPNRDLVALAALEERQTGVVERLIRRLDGEQRAFSSDEELEVTTVYHTLAVFKLQRSDVYLSDLISKWGDGSSQCEASQGRLLQAMTARQYWIQETLQPLPIRCRAPSFRQFLAKTTVLAVEHNLGVEFDPSLRQRMGERFQRDRSIGFDCGYFTGNREKLYDLNLRDWGRPSADELESFQILLFFDRNYRVRDRGPFFEAIYSRDRQAWKGAYLKGFSARKWADGVADAGDEDLEETWNQYKGLLEAIAEQRGVESFLFQDPFCWPLFMYFWGHPHREAILQFFTNLVQRTQVPITLKIILKFCEKNGGELTGQKTEQLFRICAEIFPSLPVEHRALLFFDPPLDLKKEERAVSQAVECSREFRDAMAPFGYPIEEPRYVKMMRHYILRRPQEVLRLLRGIEALGMRTFKRELIWNVVSVAEPMEPVSDPIHRQAAQQVRMIHTIYQFSESEVFALYLEVIRLVERGQGALIGEISHFIHLVSSFCPLRKREVYFLFLHHPPLFFKQVEELRCLRTRWAQEKDRSNRFILPEKQIKQILDSVLTCVTAHSQGCETDEVGAFQAAFELSLMKGFFPPWQPLIDALGVQHINRGGVQWIDDARATHVGQLQSICPNVEFYFHWSLEPIELLNAQAGAGAARTIAERPLFFVSFIDTTKMRSQSLFVPIERTIEELGEGFYPFVYALSRLVFRDKADREVSEEAPDTPETWEGAFDGVRELMQSEARPSLDLIRVIWEFLRKVKTSALNLYLQIVEEVKVPLPVYEAAEVAALGHIFPAAPRGTLLPESLLKITPEREKKYFLPDANDSFITQCFNSGAFLAPTQKKEPLNLNLHWMASSREEFVEPLFYHVQKMAGKEESQSRHITLGTEKLSLPLVYPPIAFSSRVHFERYFDLHNLLLKALAYRSGSRR